MSGRCLFLCCSVTNFLLLGLISPGPRFKGQGCCSPHVAQQLSDLAWSTPRISTGCPTPGPAQKSSENVSTHVGGCGFLVQHTLVRREAPASHSELLSRWEEIFNHPVSFPPLLTCCETGRADPGLCRFCLVFSESVYADWLLQYVHIYMYFSQELKLGVPSHWSLPSVRWQKCLFCYTLNCIQAGSSKGKIL